MRLTEFIFPAFSGSVTSIGAENTFSEPQPSNVSATNPDNIFDFNFIIFYPFVIVIFIPNLKSSATPVSPQSYFM